MACIISQESRLFDTPIDPQTYRISTSNNIKGQAIREDMQVRTLSETLLIRHGTFISTNYPLMTALTSIISQGL